MVPDAVTLPGLFRNQWIPLWAAWQDFSLILNGAKGGDPAGVNRFDEFQEMLQ